ncbi:MAG: DUF349 domain-containing protein [Flavobacteriaceae bacterium]
MQMEPTLSPEENQDKLEPTGEDQITTNAQEKGDEDLSKEENTPVSTETSPTKNLDIAVDQLALEEFPAALEKVLKNDQWMRLGNIVRDLQQSFDSQFLVILQEKKAEFIAEGGNEIDFYFAPDYKKHFSGLLKEYKQKKAKYFKEIETTQKANLNRKREIIEEIKLLVDQSDHNNGTYRQFKNLQEAFHNTGLVPRNEVNNIWQTYKFHVERFYDFLHLNRDLREADFKHNYEEKLKIIERAEALAQNADVIASIRELNTLHRLWKNDLGPVAREHREELWSRFQAATKAIHQLKNEYNKNIDSIQSENLAKKDGILKQIAELIATAPSNHNAWQNAIKKVNTLKEEFHAIGRVPKAENKRLWNSFRELSREFNQAKNLFYKEQKSQEKQYIEAKKALIEEVATILDDPNWRDHVSRMKSVQTDWKKTGRISRRLSNKLWEEFKALTNLYFDRLKNKTEALSAADQAALAAQNNFVESLLKTEAPTTPKKLERFIDEQVEQWLNLNPAPNAPAQKKLLHHLVNLWEATSLSQKEKASQKFTTQLALIKQDIDALNREHALQKKKIDEINNELIQLENNLQFFSSSSEENPVVIEVNAKIKKLSQQKEALEEKSNAIKSLKRALKKQEEAGAAENAEGEEVLED